MAIGTLGFPWAARLGGFGAQARPDPAAVLPALLAAFAGMALGARLRESLPPLAFQRALFGVFLLLGLPMLARSPW